MNRGRVNPITNKPILKTISFSSRMLRTSPRKLNAVAKLVNNLHPKEAIKQMLFCKKKCAKYISECLKSALSSAENNHNMRIDDLIITNASVGKAKCLKRIQPRAKGRSFRINKFFSNLYISLSI